MVYLDCNASTPMEPEIVREMADHLLASCGNASSRTHEYGLQAKRDVSRARKLLAGHFKAEPDGVLFTSGATESNNLAILGLASWAEKTGKKHIITTAIEHSAVLEPIKWLVKHAGFEVSILKPDLGGSVSPQELQRCLRPETGLVSVMHVNNETGVVQDLSGFAKILEDHPAFFHSDAAQGFGKESTGLENERLDMISITAHKIYGPQGVGALLVRSNGFREIPLEALTHGGGQERALRPGTQPVHLIKAFGMAAEMATRDHAKRVSANVAFRKDLLEQLGDLPISFNGAQDRVLPHVLNISIRGIDSEAAMVALRRLIAVSNGSACNSARYEPSHVLTSMNLPPEQIAGAVRFSWSHLTPAVDWRAVRDILIGFI